MKFVNIWLFRIFHNFDMWWLLNEGALECLISCDNSPVPDDDHRYCIYVFKQLGRQDPNLASLQLSRPRFDTEGFLESDGADLSLIGANKFLANHGN